MTPGMERLVDQINLMTAALEAFGNTAQGVHRHFVQLHNTRLAMAPAERRRLARDYARFTRKPSLIHKGRKPRR